jgi:hypothetical protein
MHHQVLKTKSTIDHIDGNGLNNKINNLRKCTQQENCFNQKIQSRLKTSKFKGVCFDKSRNKWISSIHFNGKQYYLGRYDNEVDAGLAYDKKAISLFGKFANTNELR